MDDRSILRDPWAWVGVAGSLGFVLLAIVVARRGGLPFDDQLAATIKGLPIPVGFWEACTFAGGPLLIPIGVVLVLTALLSRRVRLAIILAVILIGAALLTDFVKDLIARPRPPGEALAPWLGYSFPSGHTLNSTVTYGLIAVAAWRSGLPLVVRRTLVAVGVALPLLIGLSRVALGVHYPSDVLGGWLGGIAFVALGACLIRVNRAMERGPRAAERETGPPAIDGPVSG
jgi:undecaprenyl-diphosphatase